MGIYKILGAIFIVSSFMYIGYYASYMLKKRKVFISDMLSALLLVKSEIVCRFTPLTDVFKNISEIYDGDVREFFAELYNKVQNEEDDLICVWKRLLEKYSYLKKEDIDTICRYGEVLGRYDSAEQSTVIEQINERLKVRLELSEKEYENKGKLYRGCSLSFGIIAVLMII